MPRDDVQRREMLMKLTFFAIVFGIVTLAAQYFKALRRMQLPARTAYERFVAVGRDIHERSAKVFPPLFTAVLPAHRFADYAAAASPQQWPLLFEGLHSFDATYLRALKRFESRIDSEFEVLLRRHGLPDVATNVKKTRRKQAREIHQTILSSQGRAPSWHVIVKKKWPCRQTGDSGYVAAGPLCRRQRTRRCDRT
jgi:hypothetical protein